MSTEDRSPRFETIDAWPARDLVDAVVEGQLAAIAAVGAAAQPIAEAVEAAAERLGRGGRLVYVGAGTSGRIAAQDAAELGPTFDWPDDRVVILMAGGAPAFVKASEGAEDDGETARAAIRAAAIDADDVVLALAASGRTPYVLAAAAESAARGALVIGISSNAPSPLLDRAGIAIHLATGAEVVAGSTRLKAGTAQKATLNAISTAVMIRLGRVHRGLMVDMRATNAKLKARAKRTVGTLTEAPEPAVEDALARAGGRLKVAVLLLEGASTPEVAEEALAAAGGSLRRALEDLTR